MTSFTSLLVLVSMVCMTNCETINCNGDCSCPSTAPTPGETCILNCQKKDSCKSKQLSCRAGDPCIVQCINISSCADYTIIDASTSTDVSIICNGVDACKVGIDITCGTAHCNLQCLTITGCEKFGSINVARSSSFQCTNCPNDAITDLQFTSNPTTNPTQLPTVGSLYPTTNPTYNPSKYPTIHPTIHPSTNPTYKPTNNPTIITLYPQTHTNNPTITPTINPINSPTNNPTFIPSISLSINPTQIPSYIASTTNPTSNPTSNPTFRDMVFVTKTIIVYAQHIENKSDELVIILATILSSVSCICLAMYIKIYRYKYKRNTVLVIPANQKHMPQIHVKHCNIISEKPLSVCMEMHEIANVGTRNTSEGIMLQDTFGYSYNIEQKNTYDYSELYKGRKQTKGSLKSYANRAISIDTNNTISLSELGELPKSPIFPVSHTLTSMGDVSLSDLNSLYGPGTEQNNKTPGVKYAE